MEIDRDMFEGMVQDWLADHAEEMEDLDIDFDTSAPDENGIWHASARDEKCIYDIHDDGEGNIGIDYIGERMWA